MFCHIFNSIYSLLEREIEDGPNTQFCASSVDLFLRIESNITHVHNALRVYASRIMNGVQVGLYTVQKSDLRVQCVTMSAGFSESVTRQSGCLKA